MTQTPAREAHMADAGALPIWDELNWDTVTGLYTQRKATSDAMRGMVGQDDKAEQFALLSFGLPLI